jgi:hypothetical protein
MPFNLSTGIYTPASGAESAAPGQVIRSLTWNSIFTDLSTALTQVGAATWIKSPRVISSAGVTTLLTSDGVVYVEALVSTIFMQPSSLVTAPVYIVGALGSVFGGNNAVVVASGSDMLSGQGTLTLATNYQVATFLPLASGGYMVGYAPSPQGLNGVPIGNTAPGTGAFTTLTGSTSILSSGPGGVGYSTGAGGTVVQATNKTTGVTLAKTCGQITMNNAALVNGVIASFTMTNSLIAATDVLVLNHISGGTPGSYGLNAQAAAGTATINVRNNTAGTLSEAIVIQFSVVKAVNS